MKYVKGTLRAAIAYRPRKLNSIPKRLRLIRDISRFAIAQNTPTNFLRKKRNCLAGKHRHGWSVLTKKGQILLLALNS
jgi:hypothetical protein